MVSTIEREVAGQGIHQGELGVDGVLGADFGAFAVYDTRTRIVVKAESHPFGVEITLVVGVGVVEYGVAVGFRGSRFVGDKKFVAFAREFGHLDTTRVALGNGLRRSTPTTELEVGFLFVVTSCERERESEQ